MSWANRKPPLFYPICWHKLGIFSQKNVKLMLYVWSRYSLLLSSANSSSFRPPVTSPLHMSIDIYERPVLCQKDVALKVCQVWENQISETEVIILQVEQLMSKSWCKILCNTVDTNSYKGCSNSKRPIILLNIGEDILPST